MHPVHQTQVYWSIRVGRFILKFEKVINEGGVEVLREFLKEIPKPKVVADPSMKPDEWRLEQK